jgi:ABC-2 type transport system permease protein
MSDWSVFWLAVRRDLRAWRKPFLISSAVILVGVVALMTFLTIAQGDEETPGFTVGLVGDTSPTLATDLQREFGTAATVTFESLPSRSAAEAELTSGAIDGAIVGSSEMVFGPELSDWLADTIYLVLAADVTQQRAENLGLSAADVQRLADPDIRVRVLDPVQQDDSANEVVATIALIVMFMAILSYGQWIGYAVVEEKANRVVELLLGAVRPHHLMAAKVVSIGALGLAQVGLFGAVVLGFGLATDRIDVPEVAGWAVFWVLVWFILGYALYGCMYAAGGSLASNTQEAGSTFGPLSLILGFGYIGGLISLSSATDSPVLRVFSFIPLWAPLTMPARIVRGWAEWWEVGLSLTLMLLATYALVRFAGRVYVGGVSRASSKLGWREAWRSSRNVVPS